MAKKRKKQEELKAEKDYKPPIFDREEFMRTEINVAKGTVYAATMAVPMAAIAMYTLPVGGPGGGLLIGFAGISLMWFLLPMLKVNIKEFKATHWLGAISTYFFLFLAIWVMLCNPPFNDFASPAITSVEVSWNGGDWEPINISSGSAIFYMPANATENLTMTIRAVVTDNADLNADNVTIQIGAETPTVMTHDGDMFQYDVPDPAVPMFFTIIAYDTNGNDPVTYDFSLASP